MKIHRALTLLVMIAIALVCFGLISARIVSTFDLRSLVALLVLLLLSAGGGVLFSWRRYRTPGASRGGPRPGVQPGRGREA